MRLGLRMRRGKRDDGHVITVTGALDRHTRSRVLGRMHALAARQEGPLTVDVSGVSYFDSVSLTMLLGTERVIERQLACAVDIRGIDVMASRAVGLEA